jgi:hypothetical protein
LHLIAAELAASLLTAEAAAALQAGIASQFFVFGVHFPMTRVYTSPIE